MKVKPTCDKPFKIPLKFDEAMRRAVQVKPPPEGWTKYLKSLKQAPKRQRRKRTA